MSTDFNKREGIVRTDMNCHDCSHNFIAELNYSLEGNHIIECPYCGHEHCRVITGGQITSERWDSRHRRVDVNGRRVWKHDSQPAKTSTAAMFMRDRWLNRSDVQ